MVFSDHNRALVADIPPAFPSRYRILGWGCSFCLHAMALAAVTSLLRELPQAPAPVYRMEFLLTDPQSDADQATSSDPQSAADPVTPQEAGALPEDLSQVVASPSPSMSSTTEEVLEQRPLSEPAIVQQTIRHVTPAARAQHTPNSSSAAAASPATEAIAENFRDHAEPPSHVPTESPQNPVEATANVAPSSAIAPLSPHNGDSSSPLTDPAPVIDSPTGSSGFPTASATETVAMTQTVPAKSQYGWLAELLRRRTMSLLAYPHLARMQGFEGIVVVRTTIDNDGGLVDAVVTKSSGYGALDEDALKLMHRVCPIHLPQDLGKSQITVLIPIRYRLDRLE